MIPTTIIGCKFVLNLWKKIGKHLYYHLVKNEIYQIDPKRR